mgnify:CR=1 FL=1
MSEFKEYQNIQSKEIRPYVKGEDLTGISVTEGIDPTKDKGYIARDPKNNEDQWYITKKFFKENFREVPEEEAVMPPPPPLAEEGTWKFISSSTTYLNNTTRHRTYALPVGRGLLVKVTAETEKGTSVALAFVEEARITTDENGKFKII